MPAPRSPLPAPTSPPRPARPNGYRKVIATALAAVSMTVLLYAAILVLASDQTLTRDRAIVLAVFLGLHTFALTTLLGESPWPHLTKLLHPDTTTREDTAPPNP